MADETKKEEKTAGPAKSNAEAKANTATMGEPPGKGPTTGSPAPDPKSTAKAATATKLAEAQERLELLKVIRTAQNENRMMKAKLESNTPEEIAALKAQNQELAAELKKLEVDVLTELMARKKTFDATGVSDKLQILKEALVSYCKDRNIDPSLWKNLESL